MNVLSIDFDWIMEPSIEAYNKLAKIECLGPMRTWENIIKTIPSLNVECDLIKFQILYELLIQKSKTLAKDNILIALNHDAIYNFLQNDNQLHVYNIDHHHDMGYPHYLNDEHVYNTLSVANWVYYLDQTKTLQTYTWIHNKNSTQPTKDSTKLSCYYTHSTEISVLDDIQFDKIFLCASWEWVPLKYEPLFNILVSIIDKK